MAYSAAKAAVIQLSRDLGTHLARRGVRVNALCLGTVEELAGTVAYLASDDAGFVTAAAFPIDGGITSAFTVPS
jgi:NAD(P)-dependent dehydrogenase (short-subunit alcohol dehydrogenase family)